jgi:hypothetical protein
MKVTTENDNNFGYEQITIVVDGRKRTLTDSERKMNKVKYLPNGTNARYV